MRGILIYNETTGRPDLVLPTGKLLGGLHCGDCLEIWVDDLLATGRLELTEDWVLILNDTFLKPPYGQSVWLK